MMFDDDQSNTQDPNASGGTEAQGAGSADTGAGAGAGAGEETAQTFQELDDQATDQESQTEERPPTHQVVEGEHLGAVYQVPVKVSAVLGTAEMQVNQLLKLGRGAVIELDRKIGESIDVYVNDRLVARGEIVMVDEHLGVTMTEIIKSDRTVA